MLHIENAPLSPYSFSTVYDGPAPLSQPPSDLVSFSFYAFVAFYFTTEKFISDRDFFVPLTTERTVNLQYLRYSP